MLIALLLAGVAVFVFVGLFTRCPVAIDARPRCNPVMAEGGRFPGLRSVARLTRVSILILMSLFAFRLVAIATSYFFRKVFMVKGEGDLPLNPFVIRMADEAILVFDFIMQVFHCVLFTDLPGCVAIGDGAGFARHPLEGRVAVAASQLFVCLDDIARRVERGRVLHSDKQHGRYHERSDHKIK